MKILIWQTELYAVEKLTYIRISTDVIEVHYNTLRINFHLSTDEAIQAHLNSFEKLREVFPRFMTKVLAKFFTSDVMHIMDIHEAILSIVPTAKEESNENG